MSLKITHWWWHSVTAHQLEPLTYLTLAVNVQTGIRDHVWMLTLWPLTFRVDPQGDTGAANNQTKKSEVSQGTSHVRIWLCWRHWTHRVVRAYRVLGRQFIIFACLYYDSKYSDEEVSYWWWTTYSSSSPALLIKNIPKLCECVQKRICTC